MRLGCRVDVRVKISVWVSVWVGFRGISIGDAKVSEW